MRSIGAEMRVTMWSIATIILLVALVLTLTQGWSITGRALEGRTNTSAVSGACPVEPAALTASEAGALALNFVNKLLAAMEAPGNATLINVEETGGLYKVTLRFAGQENAIHLTKDGRALFLYPPIDPTQPLPTKAPQPTPKAPNVTKSARPSVELFVMSFCPYGAQAEAVMAPVVKLLGTSANISVRFITNVRGDNVSDIYSLHGLTEVKEDLRQACIQRDYNQSIFWSYLEAFNAECFADWRDEAKLEACWRRVAGNLGINATAIEACAYGGDGIALLRGDEAAGDAYGVRGSPTLIINGVTYTGPRTSEGFKQAICAAFTTQPTACGQSIASTSTGAPASVSASGGCA